VLAELFALDGRVAIVTGASSGLGETLARALSDAGAKVAVTARREDRLERLAADIAGLPFACDLLEADQADRLVATVAERLGPPEILVNVAGTLAGSYPAEAEPAASIETTLRLNLMAPYRLCQLVFPYMRDTGRGAIVNISSISGHVGIPGIPQGAYAASKLGLSGLTSELAVQWARHSIRVNTVAAGFFRSELTAPMYEDERISEWLRRNTPLPYPGETRDLVGVVLWLTSDAGRYATGQTFVVDGGWTAR